MTMEKVFAKIQELAARKGNGENRETIGTIAKELAMDERSVREYVTALEILEFVRVTAFGGITLTRECGNDGFSCR
jgi:Mn-dependent DtxR family transcriptional regulator